MTTPPDKPEPVESPEEPPVDQPSTRFIVDDGTREPAFWGSIQLPDHSPEETA